MGFAFTLIYIAMTLLSPAVFPEAIRSLHLGDIFGVLAILTILPSIPEAKLASIPEVYLAFGLLVAVCISILVTGWFGGAAQTLFDFSPILLAFYFVAISCRSLRRLKILTAVLMLIALYIFAQGAWDYFSGSFSSPYLELERLAGGETLYRFRGLGIISDPNDFAQFLVMLIPLLWIWWKPQNFARNFVFTVVPAGILIVAVYFTHSRGAVVALIAVLLFGFKDKLGVVKSSVFAALAFAGLMALNISGGRSMNDDDGGRVAAWALGLQLLKTHPLFGVGIGNFSEYNDTGNTAHNSYILSLAETGLFGYFFWMGMIVFVWIGLSRIIASQSKKTPEIDSEVLGGPDTRRDEQAGVAGSWLGSPEIGRVAVETGLNTAAFSHSALYASERNDAGVRSPYYPAYMEEDDQTDVRSEEDNLIYSAKVFRVAFVGLLTSSFFISRTYSVTLYVLLGMAVALKVLYQEKQPDSGKAIQPLLRRVCLGIFASLVVLYLFVRLRGVQ